MEKEELYTKEYMNEDAGVLIEYYLITETISEEYPELKSYGVKINKVTHYDGGRKSAEMKQINGIFYRRRDAEEFLEKISRNQVTPVILSDVTEDYIIENMERKRIMLHKRSAEVQSAAV